MPSRVTRSATELGEEHPDTPTACADLAASYWQAGRTDEAASLLRSVVEHRDRVLGPAHPDTMMCRVDLATVLTERGRDLLPGDTLRAWRDVAEAVQAVGPYPSGDQAGYGPVLARVRDLRRGAGRRRAARSRRRLPVTIQARRRCCGQEPTMTPPPRP
ncbi:tetratricopeptide repeat protein [Kitasatospora sp. NPDC089913]|uniref:tetratricopeptide repeat protein n=1 Tax=Kitasatospora sp. NPDC089913 TaxID=3364080 RepID=UPI0037F627B4